jgi:hypothetical protein
VPELNLHSFELALPFLVLYDLAHRFVHDQIRHEQGIIGHVWWRRFALAVVLAVLEFNTAEKRPGARVFGAITSDVVQIELRCVCMQLILFPNKGAAVNFGNFDVGVLHFHTVYENWCVRSCCWRCRALNGGGDVSIVL